MSSKYGLTKENLLAALSLALRQDPSVSALAEALAELLSDRTKEIGRLRIYPAIDQADDRLLDILAHDFKVDWWDEDYDLEEKRRTLKDSWRVHKLLGTKAAVEKAISAIYPETTVEEWFEYEGGEPYHFRLKINVTSDSDDPARQKRVLERLNFYKNLRSHVDEVKYFLKPETAWARAGSLFLGSHGEMKIAIPVPVKPAGVSTQILAGGGLAFEHRHLMVMVPMPGSSP